MAFTAKPTLRFRPPHQEHEASEIIACGWPSVNKTKSGHCPIIEREAQTDLVQMPLILYPNEVLEVPND